MGKPLRYREARTTVVPWQVEASDLSPMGEPETMIEWRYERHLGLHVRGQAGITLGMLAVRCVRRGDQIEPVSLAIADTVRIETDPPQSGGPRAPRGVDVDDWREHGA